MRSVLAAAVLLVSLPAIGATQCLTCLDYANCSVVMSGGSQSCWVDCSGGSCECRQTGSCGSGGGGGEEDGFKRPNPGSALPVGGEEPVLVWSALYELPGNSLGRGARGQVLRGVGRDDFDATKNAAISRGARIQKDDLSLVNVVVGVFRNTPAIEVKTPSGSGYLLEVKRIGATTRLSLNQLQGNGRRGFGDEAILQAGEFFSAAVDIDGKPYAVLVGVAGGADIFERQRRLVEAAKEHTRWDRSVTVAATAGS